MTLYIMSNFDFSKVHLLVGTPCYGGQLFNGYMESVVQLQEKLKAVGAKMTLRTISNESLITRARNFYGSLMLQDSTYTHLLFIDSDIIFHPDSVIRMLEWDKEVVAGAYPKKGISWNKVSEVVKDPEYNAERPELIQSKIFDYAIAWKAVPTAQTVTLHITNGFCRIEYAATGFLLIKQKVFVSLAKALPYVKYVNDMNAYETGKNQDCFYALFDCIIHPVTKQYLSEDYTFCKRWTDLGGEIWLDLNCNLTHIGTYHFAGAIVNTLKINS
jgi:hypothetical protein